MNYSFLKKKNNGNNYLKATVFLSESSHRWDRNTWWEERAVLLPRYLRWPTYTKSWCGQTQVWLSRIKDLKSEVLRMRFLFIVCLEDQKHRGSWSQSSHWMQMYPNVTYHTQICEKLIKLCHITGSTIGFCSAKTACL